VLVLTSDFPVIYPITGRPEGRHTEITNAAPKGRP
jgi:hypothetical protein